MINSLANKPSLLVDEKLDKAKTKLQHLIDELNKHDIPMGVAQSINEQVAIVNNFNGTPKDLRRMINKVRNKILNIARSKLQLVVPGYYRNLWMSVGMSAFGIGAIGTPLSVIFDNPALISIGMLPGMVIGLLIGQRKDIKAKKDGRQLQLSE